LLLKRLQKSFLFLRFNAKIKITCHPFEECPMSQPFDERAHLSALQAHREQAAWVERLFLLPATPAELWPYVSDTDQLNLRAGLSPTQNHFVPSAYGGSYLDVETRLGGMLARYREQPFEWVAPDYLFVERLFDKGPLSWLRFEIRLSPAEQGTELTLRLGFVSKIPLAVSKPLMQHQLKKMQPVFEAYAQQLHKGYQGVGVLLDPDPKWETQISRLAAEWQPLWPQQETVQALADYIYRAPERLASRIRPFDVAQAYGLEPLEVLRFCLRATRLGDLQSRWDLRCPSCKGPKEQAASLAQVQHRASCSSCVVSYGVDFAENMEMTFWPAAQWREVEDQNFCAGSPANTAHWAAQILLEPGQTRELKSTLPAGEYILLSPSLSGESWLTLATGGQRSWAPALQQTLSEQAVSLDPEALWSLHNPSEHLLILRLERADWLAHAAQGSLVASLPEFHELQPAGPLSPLPVSEQVILVALFAEPAETHVSELALAIAQVRGAVLQQETDALMAIFQDPLDAVQVGVQTLKNLSEWREFLDVPALSLGLFAGSCELSSHHGQLSYQGEAVQGAALLAGLAGPDQLLLQPALLNRDEIGHLLWRQGELQQLSLENGSQVMAYGLREVSYAQ